MFSTAKKRTIFIVAIIPLLLMTGCVGYWFGRRPTWQARYTTRPPTAPDLDARELRRVDEDPPEEPPAEPLAELERRPEEELSQAELESLVAEAYREGDYSRAIELLERRLERDPDQPAVLFNLGSLHYRRGNYFRARNYYEQTADLEPENVQAHKYLGAANYQLGRWEEARSNFRRVLELAPEEREVRDWLEAIR